MSASALVLGDLCIDTVIASRLPFTWQETVASGEAVFRVPIRERVGGSAFHFARQAAAVGIRPLVLGSVGCDMAGDRILAALANMGLGYKVQRTDAATTAQSIIAYDSNGVRLMMASHLNANDALSAEFVRANAPETLRASLVWLSGHCLRDRAAARWAAVREALTHAREAGAKVVLDVVPHDFDRLFPGLDELQSAVGPVDGIAAELGSIDRWLDGGACTEPRTPAVLAATATYWLDLVPFVIVRFHNGRTYWQIAAARTGFWATETREVPAGGDLVGYGDVLACAALRGYLDHLSSHAGVPGAPVYTEGGR
jgi:sugar/nucleoside kinase (ribokinase family)